MHVLLSRNFAHFVFYEMYIDFCSEMKLFCVLSDSDVDSGIGQSGYVFVI